ncbi:cytochrome P450 [Nocardia panacis]|uniref:Cytochrome P450 n=1 Tax=Nocardia panacis TaxID=2340916 RepID=A0A3A4KIY5_9NOCA|nr:cytochrome P450 [Nocardia panacis]RJO73653.1 cytochrome P450 [Nocardia panacis]
MDHPLVLDPTGTDIQGESVRIRERGAAALVELPGGVRAWSITDQALLKGLLVDSRVSKDAKQHWPAFMAGEIPPDWPLFLWVAVSNMFTAYGADHRRLRKLVAPAFTARRTEALRSRIAAITAELLDELAATARRDGIVDLREGFAYPLPIRVISELMGVPEELNPGLRTCVDGIFDTSLTPEESQANYLEMYRILTELVAFRREHPGDDMTSLLVAPADEGAQLTEQELIDTLLLVISAGHETTVNLLDQAISALLTRPVERAKVLAGQVSWSDIVEESLRYEAPVAHLPLRFATDDLELGEGIRIAKGDPILASYAAANRDPKIHGDTADVFDPTRPNKEHVAFGYGAHHCLGAPLARLEAELALPALFERFPNMGLAVDVSELGAVPSFISNGHRRVPVTLGE